MTARKAARPLRRSMGGAHAAGFALPSYTTWRDTIARRLSLMV